MVMHCCFGWIFVAGVVIWLMTRLLAKRNLKKAPPFKTLICIGSGGHTAEMLRILGAVDRNNYTPRHYVMAEGDGTGEAKVAAFEGSSHLYTIHKIYRSRRVGQSYSTSVLTTLYSILTCVPLVVNIRPDVIFCNGPGTCVPVCLIAALLDRLTGRRCRIVFVESVCRVETLSLTGKILLHSRLADVFIVQWDTLAQSDKRILYLGRLA